MCARPILNRVHKQVAIQESWGRLQGNAAFNAKWGGSSGTNAGGGALGGAWAGAKCTRCRTWEMLIDAVCEPAMWLDASACLDESQAAADTARRAIEQNTVCSRPPAPA